MLRRLLRTPIPHRRHHHHAASIMTAAAALAPHAPDPSLGLPASELTLAHTLPTGQAFRWRRAPGVTDPGLDVFDGVIGRRAVRVLV